MKFMERSTLGLGISIFTVVLIAALCSAGAFAQNPGLLHHKLRFYLHPDLTAGLTTQVLQDRISKYAEDLNTIFSKQTNRRFDFDASQDIIITSQQPHSGSYLGSPCDMPGTGYEMWIYAVLTDNPAYGTYGGGASFDSTGAGVADLLKWDAIHDRDSLAAGSAELEQYWRQIDHITHEFEHVFGAGMSEYYSLTVVRDSTGVAPIQDLDFFDLNDPYWTQHQDYWTDPLLMNLWNNSHVGSPATYTDLMNTVSFADVTVAVINDSLRQCLDPMLPDLSQARIHVADEASGQPLSNVPVKIWDVRSIAPYTAVLTVDTTTDAAGIVQFAWNGQFNNYDNVMLIKVNPGGTGAAVRWFTIFDAQEEKMLNGNQTLDIYMTLQNWPLPVSITTFEARATEDRVLLSWTTATETNNYGFEVERAAVREVEALQDTREWSTRGFVKGHGNSTSPRHYAFTDEPVSPGFYQYRLKQIDRGGKFEYSDVIAVQCGMVPTAFVLEQNYPNPFNPATVISYTIPTTSHVLLKIFDVSGQLVATPVDRRQEAGIHEVEFDASALSSGIYFYQIRSGRHLAVRKMMLLK